MILLGTRNAGKSREMRPLLESAGQEVIDLTSVGIVESPYEDRLEEFATFEENALAKARYFYEVSGGIAAVADDSGLEVAALGGRPGVRSKRFSGRDDLTGRALDDANNAALTAALSGASDRQARFVCAAAFVGLGSDIVRRGVTSGRIIDTPRGRGGFGYDAYFESTELGRTFAEASTVEKEGVSHRGRAMRALIEAMRSQ